MSALLCQYSTTSADTAHVHRLRQALEQSRSENHALLAKVHKMEKLQVRASWPSLLAALRCSTVLHQKCLPLLLLQAEAVSSAEQQKRLAAFSELGDRRQYVQLLERQLKGTK